MSLVSAKEMLLKATRERYAVGAFNVTSIVQMEAVIEAAVNKRAPLIVQTSTAPAKFFGPRVLVAAYRALAENAPIPVCLHLDHCTDVDLCKQCAGRRLHQHHDRRLETPVRGEPAADQGRGRLLPRAGRHHRRRRTRHRRRRRRSDPCRRDRGRTVSPRGRCGVRRADRRRPVRPRHRHRPRRVQHRRPRNSTTTACQRYSSCSTAEARACRSSSMAEPACPPTSPGGSSPAAGPSSTSPPTSSIRCIDTTFDYISSHRSEYDPGKVDKAVKQAIIKAIESWIDILGCAGKA